MKRPTMKILSLLLAICIVFALGSTGLTTAFAAEVPADAPSAETEAAEVPSPSELPEPAPSSAETTPAAQPSPSEMPEPSSSETPEPSPSPSETPGEFSAASTADIDIDALLALARQDGAAAAEQVNGCEDTVLFEEYVREILKVYYQEGLSGQLESFRASVKPGAEAIFQSFEDAANERATSPEELGYVPGEIIVGFADGTVSALSAADETVIDELDGSTSEIVETPADETVAVVEISPEQTVEEAVALFEQSPEVAYAEPNYLYESMETAADYADYYDTMAVPNDPNYKPEQGTNNPLWHFNKIGIPAAWDFVAAKSGNRIKVAVLDTGIDQTHEDLAHQKFGGNINYDLWKDTASTNNSATPTDIGTHGTHVAGIIGATANNSTGIAGVASGPANNVISIIPVKVFYSTRDATTPDIINGINYAVQQGAKVINMSFGGYNNSASLKNAIDAATANGAVCVAASGNSGQPNSLYPAAFDNCISVISTQKDAAFGSISRSRISTGGEFNSNYGSNTDISAPGSTIYSTLPTTNAYGLKHGTSMAAPIVAGVAAMMLYINPALSPSDVKSIICSTATDLYTAGYDDQTAWGNINAQAAVSAAANRLSPPSNIRTSQANNYSITLSWNAVSGASSYGIYRSTSKNGAYTQIGTATGNRFTDNQGIFVGNTYYYKLMSIHARPAMNSSLSSALTATADWMPYPNNATGFVQRLYELTLSRGSDTAGLNAWVSQLRNGSATGAEVASGFFFSAEYKNKNLSNSQKIDTLYRAILNRNPDPTGRSSWLSLYDSYVSDAGIFAGFVNSPEFQSLCNGYGIRAGSYTPSENRDLNPSVTAFVTRLYKLCLDRTPDISGLNAWTGQLIHGQISGGMAAYNFFYSPEFLAKNVSDSVYVDKLYAIMFNRAPDSIGKNAWVRQLQGGTSRLEVLRGFVYSPEYAQICASYGIAVGTI
ncbi:MAG: DUF4214 domain-containing protein [Christensenellaceae bacterium]|jgi:subtilisin family serine protease